MAKRVLWNKYHVRVYFDDGAKLEIFNSPASDTAHDRNALADALVKAANLIRPSAVAPPGERP